MKSTEISTFRHVMTWHPRLNTDAAHTWLRATMREIDGRTLAVTDNSSTRP